MLLNAADLARMTGGRLVGDPSTPVSGFSNDSRTLVPGQCFVAIRDQRDGHDFVADAFARGAVAAIVARAPAAPGPGTVFVVVDDTVAALGRAAASVRREQLAGSTVVGVTGSSGKTSTKDLLASALSSGARVHANESSFNNEIGLPITLLGAPADAEVVICEMGARAAGNIARLCAIARPDVGIVTNVGTAHAEFLGGRGGVARVKGELLEALTAHGLAVLNADDPSTADLATRTRATVLTAGTAPGADVRVEVLTLGPELRARIRVASPWGGFDTDLGLRGAHQAANAALAAATALHRGIPAVAVAEGLRRARGSSWRMELAEAPGGVLVLNDAYNANPDSMAAALAALAGLAVRGRRIAVLGEMRELGDASAAEHRRIGAMTRAHRIDRLIAVGGTGDATALAAAAREAGVEVVQVLDAAEALRALADRAAGDAVLVKASRVVGLEQVAVALLHPHAEVGA
jgi:UDP-N-acetylmuramoyl-tripeptide--D-alanyl-D-alanine ligase